MAFTPTYCTYDDVRTWLDVTENAMPDEMLVRPVRLAELDVDTACGAWAPYTDTGLKFFSIDTDYEVTTLEEQLALKQATCAQVEYRMLMGDDFMTKDQYAQESGPDYATSGKLRKVGSQVYALLQTGGLLRLWGGVEHKRRYANDHNSFGSMGGFPSNAD